MSQRTTVRRRPAKGRRTRITDPVLVRIRKLRVLWNDAESTYAQACIDALNDGYSYQQVADAALTDKGTMHYYVRRFAKRMGIKLSEKFAGPADV